MASAKWRPLCLCLNVLNQHWLRWWLVVCLLSPGRRQAIIWTNAGILLIEPLGTNFNEILIGIQTFSFKKMHLKKASAKWRPFCLCLNVLNQHWLRWWLVVCLAYFQLDTYKHTTVKLKSKYTILFIQENIFENLNYMQTGIHLFKH